METKKNNSSVLVTIISLILTIGGIVLEVSQTVKYYGDNWYNLKLITNVVLLILIAYYALRGYKTPHGNLTRYLFLVLSLSCLCVGLEATRLNIMGVEAVTSENTFLWIVRLSGFAAILVGYIGGRLSKIQGNAFIMVLVTILLIALAAVMCSYHAETSGSDILGILWNSISLIEWIYLVFAYAVRYKAHKEAGMAEKKE